MPADDTRRYPLAPLARAVGVQLGRIGGSQPHQPPAGLAALAEQLGISHTMAQRLNADGLSERQADKYAIALGHHPSHIWTNWWDIDELALEREARNAGQEPYIELDSDSDTDDNGDTYGFAF